MDCAPTLESALNEAEAIVLLVKHTEFAQFDPRQIAQKTKARILVDTVNACDEDAWKDAGFQVWRLGVGR
jgi:UDPglucose 6-dehydrogenase